MNRSEQAFFLLLRAGLWENPIADLTLFPLSEEEWNAVYVESRRQSVQGLLYRGFQLLPEQLFPPQGVIARWLTDIAAIEESNRRMAHTIHSSAQLLSKNGVSPVLMKGLAVAILYVHPELRSNGDIDWFIDPATANWTALETFLTNSGLLIQKAADGSLYFEYEEVEIELHRRLIDIQDPHKGDLLKQLSANEPFTTLTVAHGVTVSTTNPLVTLILLHAHLMKHAFTVGVGLRQFCDMARAYHVWHGHYEADKLTAYYKQLGLKKWSDTVHTLLVNTLGLDPQFLPYPLTNNDRQAKHLLRRIRRWGNFGQHTSSWTGHHSKRHTVTQIIRNLPFSLHYAPKEALYKIKGLIKGQTSALRDSEE